MGYSSFTVNAVRTPVGGSLSVSRPAFGPGRYQIGRSESCDIVLNDPQCVVSREHAVIDISFTEFAWIDLGVNGSSIDGRRALKNERVVLGSTNLIQIGEFVIQVQLSNQDKVQSNTGPIADTRHCNDELMNFCEDYAQHQNDRAIATIDDVLADLESSSDSLSSESIKVAQKVPQINISEIDCLIGINAQPTREAIQSNDRLTDELLCQCIRGFSRLLRQRHQSRAELGGNLTTLGVSANNPLKFIMDEAELIDAIMGPPKPGFMKGVQAVSAATEELIQYQHGLLLALGKLSQLMLAELSPEKFLIADNLKSTPLMQIEVLRKARLWDAYLQAYQSLQGSRRQLDDLVERAIHESQDSLPPMGGVR